MRITQSRLDELNTDRLPTLPKIHRKVLDRKMMKGLVTWSVLKAIDYQLQSGYGRFHVDDIVWVFQNKFVIKGIHFKRDIKSILVEYDGIFWQRVNDWVHLKSSEKVGLYFGEVIKVPIDYVFVSIDFFLTTKSRNAVLSCTTLPEDSKPMSRAEQARKFECSIRTAQSRTKRCEAQIKIQPNAIYSMQDFKDFKDPKIRKNLSPGTHVDIIEDESIRDKNKKGFVLLHWEQNSYQNNFALGPRYVSGKSRRKMNNLLRSIARKSLSFSVFAPSKPKPELFDTGVVTISGTHICEWRNAYFI
jgi:hypothetical protein